MRNMITRAMAATAFVAENDVVWVADAPMVMQDGADYVIGANAAYATNAANSVNATNVSADDEGVPANKDDTLASFLSHAALEAGEHQAIAGADALQMMTVHSAKGLEFHAVFISGMEEGLFPHENSLTEADGIEEERRLMYVALTRDRKSTRLNSSHIPLSRMPSSA